MRSRVAVTALVVAASLVGTASAEAALRFERKGCRAESNFPCAELRVPLDRSGRVPGSVDLYVERAAADEGRAGRGVVLAISGGPGQSATSNTGGFAGELLGNVGGRDVVVMDQRGTGASGALDCPELERPGDEPIDERTARCAQRLGERRSLYTTRDSVADLEALRVALGEEKVVLYGASYGTKVALGYALRHPDRVERLILDAVVEETGQDPFDRDSLAAIPRVMREICRGECAGVTHDAARDLALLADLLDGRPLTGPVVDPRGRRRTARMTMRDLYQEVRAADALPESRARLPGLVRAAIDQDPAPLLRMVTRAGIEAPREDDLPSAADTLSFTLQAATLCEEAPLPWSRTAGPQERDAQAAAAAAARPDTSFEPFAREAVLARDSNSLLFQCRRWPAAPEAPVLGPGPLPDVPALVLEGREDIRTPLEVGRRVAARFPRGRLLEVPKAGHVTLGHPCAQRALRAFFADRPVGNPCRSLRRRARVRPVPPARLYALRPSPGTRGGPGRTLRAVLLTLADLREVALDRPADSVRAGGLRAGFFVDRGDARLVRNFSYVPGVRISGAVTPDDRLAGRISVHGRFASRGILTVTRRGTVAGVLGGRRVQGRLPRT